MSEKEPKVSKFSQRVKATRDTLEFVGKFSIVIALLSSAITFYLSFTLNKQRLRMNEDSIVYSAWKVIAANPEGKFSNGRGFAIRNLAEHGVALDGLKLSNVYMSHKILDEVSMRRADLRGFTVVLSSFQKASFVGADLRPSSTDATEITRSEFQEANFLNADLRKVTFTKTDLTEANFTHTKICGARFESSDLTDTIFGAKQPQTAKQWIALCRKTGEASPCYLGKTKLPKPGFFPKCTS